MAVDAYMFFKDYNSKYLTSESQVAYKPGAVPDPMWNTFLFSDAYKQKGIFEVEDYSFDIEQTLNIGSQSGGSGAGKVTFNAFSITRKIDVASPVIFTRACAGTPFSDVRLGMRKSAGSDQSGIVFCVFCFKLVAVKTISWAHDDEAPKETATFEYGGLQVFYSLQNPDGTLGKQLAGGWNRVTNTRDDVPNSTVGTQPKLTQAT